MKNANRDRSVIDLFRLILQPERRFYALMLIYGVAVSALSLSVPLSVQVLIGTVVNSALVNQVIVLAAMLLGLLILAGLFFAIQVYVMELFERRFFSRIVSELTLRLVYAHPAHMDRINRDELVNRYFDIMTVQKSLPPLLTGGLATALQSLVGITVTSFYHPLFVLFNAVVVLLAYLVFRVFDRGAGDSSIALSTAKYDGANWLESLARSNSFFKSRRTIAYALARSATALIDERKATRICAARFPRLRLASTVDLLAHPEVQRQLGVDGVGDLVFRALRDGRMSVLPHQLDRILDVIGDERAALCASLPKRLRTQPRPPSRRDAST